MCCSAWGGGEGAGGARADWPTSASFESWRKCRGTAHGPCAGARHRPRRAEGAGRISGPEELAGDRSRGLVAPATEPADSEAAAAAFPEPRRRLRPLRRAPAGGGGVSRKSGGQTHIEKSRLRSGRPGAAQAGLRRKGLGPRPATSDLRMRRPRRGPSAASRRGRGRRPTTAAPAMNPRHAATRRLLSATLPPAFEIPTRILILRRMCKRFA